MPTSDAVIAKARSYLGTAEKPDGSNRTPFGAWFGTNGVAWCAIFVSFVFGAFNALALLGGKQAFTPTFARWFYDRKRWGMAPRRGAVVFYAFNGPRYQGRWKGICHVELVEAVNADGSFYTIGGNVGNRVKRIRRSMAAVAGFGYPDYTPAVKPKPVPPVPRPKMPLLRLGSAGGAVRTLQTALNKSFPRLLVVDGQFGPKTLAAVRSFQAKKGLEVDGVVGPKTWKSLGW